MLSLKTIFSLALCLFIFSVVEASASVLTVTTNEDTDDGVCNAHCSLREALGVVDSSRNYTIIFARELRGSTIQLTRTLEISGRPYIDGPNKRRITLKGDGTFRVLRTRGITQLEGLIITGGGEREGEGGAIYNTGTLNLMNCIISNNRATTGGAIYSYFGTVWINDSTIAGNTSTAENSTGGVETFRTSMRIINSTISGNLSQSTNGGAGGVRFIESTGWFVNGSTIVYNISNSQTDGSAGGFVAYRGSPGPISNTILAKNAGFNPDFYGQSTGARNSFVGITDSRSGIYNGINGNIVGSTENPADPQITLLTDNGGVIPTHALLNTSRAIDAGGNTFLINNSTDQRSFDRIVNSIVDIGAVEYNSQTAETSSQITGQITNLNGRGISGARVTLRNQSGELKTVVTNPFGYYQFINAPFAVYTVEVTDKRYAFNSQNFLAEEKIEYVNFVAK